MTKPTIFIGSSSESLDIAEALQEGLDHEVEATVWSQGFFELMKSTMETLEVAISRFDFGLFVFTPDDVTRMRGAESPAVRDNVLFELGLFLGRLGRERTFILSPRGVDLHLPTDLVGLTPATYEPQRQDGNLVAALGSATTKVKRAIRKQGPLARALPLQTTPAVEEADPTVNPPGREGMRKSAALLSVRRGRRGSCRWVNGGDRGAFGCVLPAALTGL